jgi:hypothetical protein
LCREKRREGRLRSSFRAGIITEIGGYAPRVPIPPLQGGILNKKINPRSQNKKYMPKTTDSIFSFLGKIKFFVCITWLL